MKKIFFCIALLCLVKVCDVYGWTASTAVGSAPVKYRPFEIINTSGDYQIYEVETSIVAPNKTRILGFDIIPNIEHSELFVALYDYSADTPNELIDEAESPDSNTVYGEWYVYPPMVESQLNVHQGAQTTINLYLE